MNTDIVAFVIICIFVFAVIREVLTWYWKINEIVSLLKRISAGNDKTNEMITLTKEDYRKGTAFLIEELKEQNDNLRQINRLIYMIGKTDKNDNP